VLTEDEVNPVMSAILDAGLDVTALAPQLYGRIMGAFVRARKPDTSGRPSRPQ